MLHEFSRSTKRLAPQALVLLILGHGQVIEAQDSGGWTAHLGVGINTPVGRTSDFVHISGAFTAGLGYRITGRQTVLLQYYATDLPFNISPLDQLSFIHPSSELYAVTANYRLEFLDSAPVRPYVIGGSGWYHRIASITRPSGIGEIVCSPWLVWWNYQCEAGTIPLEKVVAGSISNALGFNVGAGLSRRIRNTSAHWYAEIRYHYAPHAGVPTVTLPLTFGLAW